MRLCVVVISIGQEGVNALLDEGHRDCMMTSDFLLMIKEPCLHSPQI